MMTERDCDKLRELVNWQIENGRRRSSLLALRLAHADTEERDNIVELVIKVWRVPVMRGFELH